MDRSLFIISTLACLASLATAQTWCVTATAGSSAGSRVPFKPITSPPGTKSYGVPDECLKYGMTHVGLEVMACGISDGDVPIVLAELSSFTVTSIVGAIVTCTGYCV